LDGSHTLDKIAAGGILGFVGFFTDYMNIADAAAIIFIMSAKLSTAG
jgi:hypothetical protein